MKRLLIFITLLTLFLISNSPTTYAKSSKKPVIAILTTGGGISGSLYSKDNTEFTVGNISGDAMLFDIAEINEHFVIKTESIASVASQDMTKNILTKLANRVQSLVKDSKIDGIVITHGTDTIEETAYLLNIIVNTSKPIVLVGAARPYNHFSPDGPDNLFNAIFVAGSRQSNNKGVVVAMNNEIYSARDVSKISTSGIQSVGTYSMGLLGYVDSGIVNYSYTPTKRHTKHSQFNVSDYKNAPKVEIIYAHPGYNLSINQLMNKQNIKGLIIAGTGNGNMNKKLLSIVKQAREKNIVVVRSSRTHSGIVSTAKEINDRKLSLVSSNNLNPQKSRLLLMLSLTKTKDLVKIQQIFNTY